MRIVPFTARDGVDAARVDALRPSIERHATVQDLWDWCRAQRPPVELADVVVQDQFSHDLVVVVAADLALVYEST